MARSRGGIAWLQRLWRRSEEAATHPGTARLLAAEPAVAALEAQLCEGLVWGAGATASAAAARQLEQPGPAPRNVFGRPVVGEYAARAGDRVAVATGMALSGLRASAFLRGDELVAAHAALRDCARRQTPLVLHAACGGAGQAELHGVADSGCFQVLASSGQDALDWSLVARWVAERALVPGLVATDASTIGPLRLPEAGVLAGFVGLPDEVVPAPTEAQRILFGARRPRVLPWFDPDRPVATGGVRGDSETARARTSALRYFWDPVTDLIEQGMSELNRLTGRALGWVERHQLDDADTVLVARGAAIATARSVAAQLRQQHGWKIGVLGLPWLRPFPAAAVADALANRRSIAVIEALGAPPPGGAPLARELSAGFRGRGVWVSAICDGAGPDPGALAALCARLREPDPPAHVDLEQAAVPKSTGFPRRDALLQSLVNADVAPRTPALPVAQPPSLDPPDGRSAGVVALEAELPLDALGRLAAAVSAGTDEVARGAEVRPETGVWHASLRVAPRDFADPGPRAPVSALLLLSDRWQRLGDPLASLAPEGTALFATASAPERVWDSLPQRWRRSVRERELRLYTVPPDFDAALAVLASACRGEQSELAGAHEIAWQKLPAVRSAEPALPGPVRRVSRLRPTHDSLPRFWGEVAQPRQAGAGDGVIDPLSAVGAVPAAASALQPAAATPPLPRLDPDACSACGRCWSVCPDSAIGATALPSEALLTAASRAAHTEGAEADALRRAHKHLADRIGRVVGKRDAEHGQLDAASIRSEWDWLRERLAPSDEALPRYEAAFGATLELLEQLEPVYSEPLFRRPERETRGSGALLSLAFDPRACLGCGLCVAACPEQALELIDRTPERVARLETRWRTWEALPDTPGEVLARAADQPEIGQLAAVLLSRHCGQAQAGGGEGEPGSGERLAGRLVAAMVEYAGQRRAAEIAEQLSRRREELEAKVRSDLGQSLSAADVETLHEALGSLGRSRGDMSDLATRLDALGSRATFDRSALLRATQLAGDLERRHERLVSGADGLGRARFGVVVARGPASDWAGRYPGHPYYAPLTVAATSEGVQLARGIARGLVAEHLATQRELRRAALLLEAPPDLPAREAAIAALTWEDLDAGERLGCPPLLLLGDDRALLEEGFEALAALLVSDLPIKVVLLDGGSHLDGGPEPALAGMAHRRAFVLATSLAHPAHFAAGLGDALAWSGPALVHVYAPSPWRHGFAVDATLERARLAVESRAHVLLRYDPSAPGVFGLRASTAGNPAPDAAFGELDFAGWAAGETRFAEHFAPVEDGQGAPLRDWIELPEDERSTRVPVVEVDGGRRAVDAQLARAAAERSAVWQALRELTGGVSPFTERLRGQLSDEQRSEREAELAALRSEYEARLAEARDGSDGAALERLTARLLALSGFDAPAAPPGDGS